MRSTTIQYSSVTDLYLDSKNPRLGREAINANLNESELLKIMGGWSLPELATSFLESGFFPQEALIVINESTNSGNKLIAIEGNRRLATIKLLFAAANGEATSKPWAELAEGLQPTNELFTHIPYIVEANRKDVSAYLGFRHVSGIKEWRPAEKAQFITKLIDEEGYEYDQVRRKIGSKTPTVRQLYISYKLLLQMEENEEIDIEKVEKRFSLLYLAQRTEGVRKYLGINIESEPSINLKPVTKENENKLINFSKWVFGTDKQAPLFDDSRQIDAFGKILLSADAVSYLERTVSANWDMAYQYSGGSEVDVSDYLMRASDNIREALSQIHLHKKSTLIHDHVKTVIKDALELLDRFPEIKAQFETQKSN
jgi:hypothetical protein